jgi:hypothetical protein
MMGPMEALGLLLITVLSFAMGYIIRSVKI